MDAKNLRKIIEQLDAIRADIASITDKLSDNQVKFSWYCHKCKTRNVWTWDKFDYEPWTVNQLECEHCGKTTKISKQPKQI